jgi:hypothetical protein
VEDARPIDGEGEAGAEILAERRGAVDRGEYREAAESHAERNQRL